VQRKRHLGEDESSYAVSADTRVVDFGGVRIATAICAESGFDGPFDAMAGQAGSTADEDFPGLAALVRPDGTVTARLPDWRPGTLAVDIPLPLDLRRVPPGRCR
jgi:predicted amidohydrolase